MQRRTFLGTLSAGVLAARTPLPADEPLELFIKRYIKAMNAPGLTLALIDRTGAPQTSGFGYSDLDLKSPVTSDLLFEIGSITKSFVALTLLKLREEGKVDFQKPILDYLPWLPIEANYGAITTHHLLTHSSGLPDALSLFLSDPQARHVQGFTPGQHFHYCNVGFCILGHLICKLDGKPWPDSVRSRIFQPLGMTSTYAVINDQTKARRTRSYVPFYGDRTYPRNGQLGRASELVFEDAAGSITSTPGDMALYLQMLIARGKAVVSEESFAAFSKPYIGAPEFSPTASYGYGIGVDKLDGHTILRHTGGMVSFASSMHVDLDGGVAAFASINSMQGYRPTPVTQYAVQLMNAKADRKPVPPPPDLPDSKISNAHDYAGSYRSANGKQLEVAAELDRVIVRSANRLVSLERTSGDEFLAIDTEWNRFPLLFGRSAEKGPVVELSYGPDWYVNASYTGPASYPESPEFKQFTGFYQADNAWSGSVRIVLRKGQLWADGATPLTIIGKSLFRVGEEPQNPDTVEFYYVVDGKAQLMKWNGADFWRIAGAGGDSL